MGKVDHRARFPTHAHTETQTHTRTYSAPRLGISSGLAFSLSLPDSQLLRSCSCSSSAPPLRPSPRTPSPPVLSLLPPPARALYSARPLLSLSSSHSLPQPCSSWAPLTGTGRGRTAQPTARPTARRRTGSLRPWPSPAWLRPPPCRQTHPPPRRPPLRIRAAPPPADQPRAQAQHGTRKRWGASAPPPAAALQPTAVSLSSPARRQRSDRVDTLQARSIGVASDEECRGADLARTDTHAPPPGAPFRARDCGKLPLPGCQWISLARFGRGTLIPLSKLSPWMVNLLRHLELEPRILRKLYPWVLHSSLILRRGLV